MARRGDRPSKRRQPEQQGFSLHAATRVGADDEAGREALLKYELRPPIASERLQRGPDGLVRIALKRPFSDGTVAIDMERVGHSQGPAILPRLTA